MALGEDAAKDACETESGKRCLRDSRMEDWASARKGREMENYITGLQHIGVPTKDIEASIAFYESLGFKTIYETVLDGATRFAYLELKGLVIETFETDAPADATGAIDHITLDVTDIDAIYALAKEKGYTITDGGGINSLPLWDNGIKYIMLEGPSRERVELTQIL